MFPKESNETKTTRSSELTKPSHQLQPSTQSFYQRQLPESCVSFTSDAGKSFFRTALAAGHLESFFPLASQLVTQHEPSFCGLATLCTVLNALGVDPKRVWKHPWRWFEQDMLDCCRPLDSIRQNGITLAELNCLARCNGLQLTTRSPPDPAIGGLGARSESLDQFRADVASATRSASQFIVVSFSRASLGQTGTGHFSPIAGYSPADDRVLVLDVARFKYPSYWVPLQDLYQSMVPIDPASGRPRGYSIFSHFSLVEQSDCPTCKPPSITRITLNKSSWYVLYKTFDPVLRALDAAASFVARVRTIHAHLAQSPFPSSPIELRPGLEHQPESSELVRQLSDLGDLLELPDRGDSTSPLLLLFALAILPRDHPPAPRSLNLASLATELAYLRAQFDALGECCSLEHEQPTRSPTCQCNKTPLP